MTERKSPFTAGLMRRNAALATAALCALALACGGEDSDRADTSGDPSPASSHGAAAPADAIATDASPESGAPATAAVDGLPVPPARFPRGLVHSAEGVSPGYVLFNPLLSGSAFLIDNEGHVVHSWESPYAGGGGMYLLPNGNLLRPARDPEALRFTAGGTGGILQELDWDGNVVWEWRLSEDDRVHHHDVEPMPNGNLLVLAWELKSADEARSVGRRADLTPEQGLWTDYVVEVKPRRPRGAEIVWEWHAWDHLVQDTDPDAPDFGDPAEHPGRLDINAGGERPALSPDELAQLQALGYVDPEAKPEDLRSDILHANAIDYHPRLDQIAISIPFTNEIWIIDHATTTGEARGPKGDLLYRWGNPATYGRAGREDQRLFAQHDVRWIPDGAEGAGNLTILNNGLGRPDGHYTTVEEWAPPLESDGRYALEARAPFGPEEPLWVYRGDPPSDLFSPIISGATRLPNGNTMICEGTGGRFLEVTKAGDVVWEYRNPYSGDIRNADGSPAQPIPPSAPFAVFRATRIPPDHPALAGRTLEPHDPQPPVHEMDADG
jgi:hypothetical protein